MFTAKGILLLVTNLLLSPSVFSTSDNREIKSTLKWSSDNKKSMAGLTILQSGRKQTKHSVEKNSTGERKNVWEVWMKQTKQPPITTTNEVERKEVYFRTSLSYFRSNSFGSQFVKPTLESELLSFTTTLFEEKVQRFTGIHNQSVSCLEPNGTTECEVKRNKLIKRFYKTFPVSLWKEHGFFTDNFVECIHDHWLETDPVPATVHYLLAIVYLVVMIFGFCGNGLVIIIFLRSRSLRTPSNYLILNLAFSDFIMASKMPLFVYNSYYEGPALGSVGCSVYGFVGGLTGTCSIMTLTMISIDRSSAILYPLNPSWKTTKRRALQMIMVVWIYSVFFSSLPLFGVNAYVPEGLLTSCSFDYLSTDTLSRAFVFVFFLAAWLLPITIIIYSYFSIFRVVLSSENARSANAPGYSKSRKRGKYRRDVKIAMIGSMIVLIWLLAWTPYALVALIGIFGGEKFITSFISEIPALFCKSSSCINPFVYAITHPSFKNEFRVKCGMCYNILQGQRRHRTRRGISFNSNYSTRSLRSRRMLATRHSQSQSSSLTGATATTFGRSNTINIHNLRENNAYIRTQINLAANTGMRCSSYNSKSIETEV